MMIRATITMLVAAATWNTVAAAQSLNSGNSAVDSTDSTTTLIAPYRAADVRVDISVSDKRLTVVVRGDTVRTATVSLAEGRDFTYAGRRWHFATPRGAMRVLGKRTDPVWLPPDWHYAEVAQAFGLKLRQLPPGGTKIRDGARIVVRDSLIGLVFAGDTVFRPLPVDEHIVFDSTLFIPPINTHNRRLIGELGKYALDLGNGYLLHGTQNQDRVGVDPTHGCIRLTDEDLEWMYQYIPVGATVRVR